jgi:rhodanese-related sulfurtransferase
MWACTSKEEKYKNLTSAQFEQLIKDSTIQLVDVRTVAEYTEGYIPGSLNVNVKDEEGFPLAVDELLDKDRPVAVYCRSGRRSRTAAELLIKKGFQKVYNLDKGILNWMEEGREINKPTE